MKAKIKRLWEIDALRGIAIILMIIYHAIFNLSLFGNYEINLYSPFLFIFQRSIGGMFLLLVGISLTLSYNKNKLNNNNNFLKYLKRGIIIFMYGMVATLISWLFYRQGYIRFGVLHLIGLSIIISYPLIKYKYLNLGIGILAIIIGDILTSLQFNFSYLLWLGFIPTGFYTMDYYPVLPYLGIILIGIFLGNMFYPNYKRKFKLFGSYMEKPNKTAYAIISKLEFLGRHSLLIYFVHQPILLGLMFAFGIMG